MSATLTLSAPAAACEDYDGRFAYTPQISDASFFTWLDAFCGDQFNRVVVRLFGPA